MTPAAIVSKLWNYCNVLRDDGMSYGDYVEQLTYLLFLKMADERTKSPYSQKSTVPADYSWPTLVKKDGDELFDHYRHTLENLGNEKGLLGLIFNKSQNKFQDPAKLRRLVVDLIGNENWSVMSADVKGDAYEGLLEKNAQDTKSGAGQYFTPRPLIQAIIDVVAVKPGETVCDPACGTGGFLLAAHDSLVANYPHMTKDERKKLKQGTFKGCELVQSTARLCAMNLMLHGIGGDDSALPLAVSQDSAQVNRQIRKPTWNEKNPNGRWRCYDYEELISRDKASLDIFWLKDESLEDSDNLPEPGVLAAEIVEDLQAALEQFREIAADLGEKE